MLLYEEPAVVPSSSSTGLGGGGGIRQLSFKTNFTGCDTQGVSGKWQMTGGSGLGSPSPWAWGRSLASGCSFTRSGSGGSYGGCP